MWRPRRPRPAARRRGSPVSGCSTSIARPPSAPCRRRACRRRSRPRSAGAREAMGDRVGREALAGAARVEAQARRALTPGRRPGRRQGPRGAAGGRARRRRGERVGEWGGREAARLRAYPAARARRRASDRRGRRALGGPERGFDAARSSADAGTAAPRIGVQRAQLAVVLEARQARSASEPRARAGRGAAARRPATSRRTSLPMQRKADRGGQAMSPRRTGPARARGPGPAPGVLTTVEAGGGRPVRTPSRGRS